MNVSLVAHLAMVLMKRGPVSAGELQAALLVDAAQFRATLCEARQAGIRIEEFEQEGDTLFRLPYARQAPRQVAESVGVSPASG